MSDPVTPGYDPCERCSELGERGPGCPWCGAEGQIRQPASRALAELELDAAELDSLEGLDE